jgi:hypothetical protein
MTSESGVHSLLQEYPVLSCAMVCIILLDDNAIESGCSGTGSSFCGQGCSTIDIVNAELSVDPVRVACPDYIL